MSHVRTPVGAYLLDEAADAGYLRRPIAITAGQPIPQEGEWAMPNTAVSGTWIRAVAGNAAAHLALPVWYRNDNTDAVALNSTVCIYGNHVARTTGFDTTPVFAYAIGNALTLDAGTGLLTSLAAAQPATVAEAQSVVAYVEELPTAANDNYMKIRVVSR